MAVMALTDGGFWATRCSQHCQVRQEMDANTFSETSAQFHLLRCCRMWPLHEACTTAWGVCRHRESFFSLIWRVWDLLYLRWCWDEFKMSLKWFDWDVCVWIWCGWCDIFEFWILNWAPSLLIVQVQKRLAAEQQISAAELTIYMSAVALNSL